MAPPAGAQPRSFSIERFAVTLEVEPDATLRVRESITFDFRGSHQGIFRTIPVRYERRGLEFALRVDDIHVFDESVAPLKTEVSRLGHAIRIRAWVPGALNAVKTVIITYRMRRALIDVDGHEELYWNVTGTEWDVPIRQAEAVVSSPPGIPLDRVVSTAYTGPPGASGSDYVEERADSFLTFRTTRTLRPREGLTIAVGWPPGAVHGPAVLQKVGWFLGDNWPLALPLLALAGVLLVWRLYGRDPGGSPTIKPEYQPPEGMMPAAGGALVSERATPRDVVATLVDLAVRGFIRIEEIEPDFGETDYVIHRLKGIPDDAQLKPLERSLLGRLFGSNWSLTERRLSEVKRDYDTTFPPVRDEIYRMMVRDGLFPSSPESVRALWLFAGLAMIGAAAFILTSGAGRFVTSPGPLGIGLGLAGLIVAALSPLMPRKTLRGAQAMVRVKGFREFLERTGKDELRRLPPDTMHKWLAWAIALGISERWIHAFDGLSVSEPTWYSGRGSFDLGTFDRSLTRFAASAEQAIVTSRRGGDGSWSGGGGTSGGSSGGGMGGGGGGTF
jgi:uncharacterized membrane protein YgcG